MTPDSAASLLPEIVRRVERLEVRARYVVEGFLSGLHRSPYFGQSLEFREHRQYAPGDDPRHVDWKVWARQDRLYVKQYEEDTNLRALFLVDQSASMAYGGGPMTKHEYAATLASALAYLLLRQNDAAGCMTFAGDVLAQAPTRSSRGHLASIVELLATPPSGTRSDLGAVTTAAASQAPRRGLVLLLSDLLADPAGLKRGLRQLHLKGHDLVVLQVLDDDELDFPFTSAVRFEGLESEDRVSCNPRALKADYLNAMQKFLEDTRRVCLANNAEYMLVRTGQPFDAVLSELLGRRQTRSRARDRRGPPTGAPT